MWNEHNEKEKKNEDTEGKYITIILLKEMEGNRFFFVCFGFVCVVVFFLLDSDRLGEVSREININTLNDGQMIGKQLQRNDVD